MTRKTAKWKEDQPIYRQICDELIARILDGIYPEGELLPSVRQVADEFDVSNLTGAKVLQEMDLLGLTVKRRGVGSEVRTGARDRIIKREQRDFINEEWPALRERLRRIEVDIGDLLRSLDERE